MGLSKNSEKVSSESIVFQLSNLFLRLRERRASLENPETAQNLYELMSAYTVSIPNDIELDIYNRNSPYEYLSFANIDIELPELISFLSNHPYTYMGVSWNLQKNAFYIFGVQVLQDIRRALRKQQEILDQIPQQHFSNIRTLQVAIERQLGTSPYYVSYGWGVRDLVAKSLAEAVFSRKESISETSEPVLLEA